MGTKRQRRTDSVKHKKTRKNKRLLLFSVMVVAGIVFLALFFITLFDYIYPPTAGKQTAGKKERQEVTLFFSDENERFLVPEKRFVAKQKEPQAQGAEMVKALLAGSKTGLVNTFPEKVDLKEVRLEGKDTLVVNFGEDLVENHPGGSTAEMATVYSLTNTLTTNLPAIRKVRILIGGKSRESLKGHIGLSEPFTLNRELIAPASSPKKEG